jgi:hypothetical protein
MIIALLIAGIAFVLAGALGIFLGIPVKEFSFGNTLILAGVVAGCTGLLTLCLAAVLRELKQIAGHLEAGAIAMPSSVATVAPRSLPPESPGFTANRDQAGRDQVGAVPDLATPPWHEETATRDRARNEPPVPAAPAQRRNLMFSSSRKEGAGRSETRVTDVSATDPRAVPPAEPAPSTFEGAWPAPERGRSAEPPPPRRVGRMPSSVAEPATGNGATDRPAPAAREENQPAVTVIKSGIVDGMAYSLYSDGSIEAQMPEGMMRFGSIDELRSHLDHRS